MTRKILLHPEAQKSLKEIAHSNRKQAQSILNRMDRLGEVEGDVTAIKQLAEDIYCVRQGDFRIIFSRTETSVIILKIVRRNEATYRDLASLARRMTRMLDEMDHMNKKKN